MKFDTVDLVSKDEFLSDRKMVGEFLSIGREVYLDPTFFLDSYLSRWDRVYVRKNSENRLIGMFAVAYDSISCANSDGLISLRSTFYLGLSIVEPSSRGGTVAGLLYRRAIDDAALAQDPQSPFIAWATTASSLIFSMFGKLCIGAQPDPTGLFSEESARIAWALRDRYWPHNDSSHPFVLRKCATNRRYQTAELERQSRSAIAGKPTLLGSLEINQAAGDRLLMIGGVKG